MCHFLSTRLRNVLSVGTLLLFWIRILIKLTHYTFWALNMLFSTLQCIILFNDLIIAGIFCLLETSNWPTCRYTIWHFQIRFLINLTDWNFWAADILLRALFYKIHWIDLKIICAIFYLQYFKMTSLWLHNFCFKSEFLFKLSH